MFATRMRFEARATSFALLWAGVVAGCGGGSVSDGSGGADTSTGTTTTGLGGTSSGAPVETGTSTTSGDPAGSESTTGALGTSSSTGDGSSSDSGSSTSGTTGGVIEGHAIALGTGYRHTCVVIGVDPAEGGWVRCWGEAEWGQLGNLDDEHIGDDELPPAGGFVQVGGPVVQIDGSWRHTCAVLVDGGVRCWGWGFDGRLGYGNRQSVGLAQSPSTAGDVDVGGAVTWVGTGTQHTCALLDGGSVRCWGYGADGRLGYGNTESIGDDESPASAGDVALGGTVEQLTVGDDHACALLEGGTVRCWGQGFSGVLGQGVNGDIGDDETPADIDPVDIGGTVTKVVAGGSHTCALLDTGNVRCWGLGDYGVLGYGNSTTIGDNETPASAGDVDVGATVVDITAGRRHTCAQLEGGVLRCWGNGSHGRLGYGNTDNVGGTIFAPVADAGTVEVGGPIVEASGGEFHTCAILDGGALRCWGRSDLGQLGYGNTDSIGDNELPSSAGDVPLF